MHVYTYVCMYRCAYVRMYASFCMHKSRELVLPFFEGCSTATLFMNEEKDGERCIAKPSKAVGGRKDSQ